MKAAIIFIVFLLITLATRGENKTWVFGSSQTLLAQFDIEAEDGAALSYLRGSTPFCFGLYVGFTNTPERSFELVCVFTNAPMLPDFSGMGTGRNTMKFLRGRVPNGPFVFSHTNYPPGMTVNYQVRGWLSNLGMSYEEALANDREGHGFFGQTGVGTMMLVPIPGVPPALFGTKPGQLMNFVMSPRRK